MLTKWWILIKNICVHFIILTTFLQGWKLSISKVDEIKSWTLFKFDDSKIGELIPNCFRYVIRLSE